MLEAVWVQGLVVTNRMTWPLSSAGPLVGAVNYLQCAADRSTTWDTVRPSGRSVLYCSNNRDGVGWQKERRVPLRAGVEYEVPWVELRING